MATSPTPKIIQLYRNENLYADKAAAVSALENTAITSLNDGTPVLAYYGTVENQHALFAVVRNNKANYIDLAGVIDAASISVERIADVDNPDDFYLAATTVQDALQELYANMIEDEAVTAAAINAIADALGDSGKDSDGRIKYTAPSADAILKTSISFSDADELLSAKIQDIAGTKADKTDIPTKTSQLTNDSGYLTESTWKIVRLTQAEYDALPTKDENTFYYITDAPELTVPSSTDFENLETRVNSIKVPTKTSQLKNDSGFITEPTLKIWSGTQAEYDAIETKDENTVYIIHGDVLIWQAASNNLVGSFVEGATEGERTFNYNGKSMVLDENFSVKMNEPLTNLNNAFTDTKLKTLDKFPYTSNVTNMSNMFYKCSGLTSLDVSNWDTSKVTNMSYTFSKCSSLTSLDVSNWNVSNVTSMGGMFSYCIGLTSLDVSNWNVSNVTNMGATFSKCSSLTSLDVSNWDVSNVTHMESMFFHCSGLTSLDVSNWDTSKVTNMSNMLYGCNNLNHIKCKQAFKDWCITNQDTIKLPTSMREGGSGTWEIVD